MAITVYKKGTVKQKQLKCEIFPNGFFFFQNHEMEGKSRN